MSCFLPLVDYHLTLKGCATPIEEKVSMKLMQSVNANLTMGGAGRRGMSCHFQRGGCRSAGNRGQSVCLVL